MKTFFRCAALLLLPLLAQAQVPTIINALKLTGTGIVNGGTATPFTEFEVDSTSTSSPRGIMSAQFSTGTDGARLHFRKARGTRAAPTTVVTGDNIGRLVGTGYDGSNYLEMASIYFAAEGTIAATRVPTNIQFWTATNAAPSVITEAARFTSSQNLLIGTTTEGTGRVQLAAGASDATSGITFAAALSVFAATTGQLNIQTTASAMDVRVRTTGGRNIDIQSSDTNAASILDSGYSTSGNFTIGTTSTGRSLVFATGAQTTALTLNSDQTANFAKTVSTYNGIATAGNGVPSIQGAGRVTAQTAANSSIATYTVGASDASFIISANVLVTASATHTFSIEAAYTDEGNTARTVTFNVQQLGGTLITSITNVTGVGPYEGVPLHIRAKASTSITIRTNSGGTYTSVTYNAEGVVQKLQ